MDVLMMHASAGSLAYGLAKFADRFDFHKFHSPHVYISAHIGVAYFVENVFHRLLMGH